VIEAASNALEAMAIAAGAIPAAGNSVSAGFEFANALQEFFAENYAANYSEGYEQQLACDLFCYARTDCNLSIDDMIDVINARFAEPFDVVTFAAIMVRIGSGTIPGQFVGQSIVDAMFLLYFTALKFGQQFGDVIGLRPLPVIISLGADQLASDNWEVLCECPDEFEHRFDFTIDEQGWAAYLSYAQYSAGVGWVEDDAGVIWIWIDVPDSGRKINSVRFETLEGNQIHAQVAVPDDASGGGEFVVPNAPFTDYTVDLTGVAAFASPVAQFCARISNDGFVPVTGTIVALTVSGEGSDPF